MLEDTPRRRGRPPLQPKAIKLNQTYGFFDDDDQPHMWQKDTIVRDENEIAMIIGRKFYEWEKVR